MKQLILVRLQNGRAASHQVDASHGRVGLHRLQKMSSTHISDTRVVALCKQLASRIAACEHLSSATAISKLVCCLPDQHASLCCLSSAPERCAPLTRQTIRDVAEPTALFAITVVQNDLEAYNFDSFDPRKLLLNQRIEQIIENIIAVI